MLGCASAGHVLGRRVHGDAPETADGDGLQLSGADESVAGGSADTESACGLFDGEENQRGVIVSGRRGVAVLVQDSLLVMI